MVSGNKKRNKNKRDKKKPTDELIDNPEHQEDADEVEKTQSEEEHIDSETVSNKRSHSEDDSDAESEPKKKKKKKKQPESTESSDKKSKSKSIRQTKREKHAQRKAEAEAAAKDQLKTECLNYLSQWKHDKSNWKFMKAKQVWLYKNKFSTYLVPDASWSLLLEYFESAKGNIRNMLLGDANKVIKQMDDWIESQNKKKEENDEETEEEETKPEIDKPDDLTYKRARDLIQCLGE